MLQPTPYRVPSHPEMLGLMESLREVFVSLDQGEHKRALSLIRVLTARTPDLPELQTSLAQALQRSGNFEESGLLTSKTDDLGISEIMLQLKNELGLRRFDNARYLLKEAERLVGEGLLNISGNCRMPRSQTTQWILIAEISRNHWSVSEEAQGPIDPNSESREPPSLQFLKECMLLSGEWILLDNMQSANFDSFYHVPSTNGVSSYLVACASDKAMLRMPKRIETISSPAFLLGGSNNYYHWLIDFLPKLACLDQGADASRRRIVVNASMTSFETDSLAAAGIDMGRVLPCWYPGAYRFSDLAVPRRGPRVFRTDGVPNNWIPATTAGDVSWLRKTFSPIMANGKGWRRLFISRTDSGSRQLLNEAEVFDSLGVFGFELVRLSDMCFSDQVALFSDTELVVGAHGAGFANIVFAPVGAALIEFVGQKPAPRFFSHLAGLLQVNYFSIVGTLAEGATVDNANDQDFFVDPARVVRAIKAALSDRP